MDCLSGYKPFGRPLFHCRPEKGWFFYLLSLTGSHFIRDARSDNNTFACHFKRRCQPKCLAYHLADGQLTLHSHGCSIRHQGQLACCLPHAHTSTSWALLYARLPHVGWLTHHLPASADYPMAELPPVTCSLLHLPNDHLLLTAPSQEWGLNHH